MPDQDEVDATGRLLMVLPHLEIAAGMAKIENPGKTIEFAVCAKSADGTGHVTASFQCEEFLKDLRTLLGDGEVD